MKELFKNMEIISNEFFKKAENFIEDNKNSRKVEDKE